MNNGHEHHFYGTVIAFLADTIAAHEIGGFKIGASFAFCKCRVCMATDTMIQTKVYLCMLYSAYHNSSSILVQ